MAKRAEITLEWAGGEYTFALKGAQIEELEATCFNPATRGPGIGLGAIFNRVMDGTWFASDIRNVIRLGLEGGGMGPTDAGRMCRHYVDGLPLSNVAKDIRLGEVDRSPDSPLLVAQAVLIAAVVGVEADDTEGEPRTPET